MAGEEPGRAVGLEPGHVAMPARVGVQRLFLRGEGVEQRETGLAFDVLVVPLEQEFRAPCRGRGLRLVAKRFQDFVEYLPRGWLQCGLNQSAALLEGDRDMFAQRRINTLVGTVIAGAALSVAAFASAGWASAATSGQGDGPQVGSPCLSSELNTTASSRTGATVRCLADDQQGYIWQADTVGGT